MGYSPWSRKESDTTAIFPQTKQNSEESCFTFLHTSLTSRLTVKGSWTLISAMQPIILVQVYEENASQRHVAGNGGMFYYPWHMTGSSS